MRTERQQVRTERQQVREKRESRRKGNQDKGERWQVQTERQQVREKRESRRKGNSITQIQDKFSEIDLLSNESNESYATCPKCGLQYSEDSGMWIACDGCQNWFNLSCTNISNSKKYWICFTVKIVCRKSICLCNVCFSNYWKQPVICVTRFMIRNGLLFLYLK